MPVWKSTSVSGAPSRGEEPTSPRHRAGVVSYERAVNLISTQERAPGRRRPRYSRRRRRSATTRALRPNSTAETRRLWSSLKLSCCRHSPSANCRRSTPSSRKLEVPVPAASASRSWRPPGRSRERSDGSSSSSSSARAPTRSPRGRTCCASSYARSSRWSRRARSISRT